MTGPKPPHDDRFWDWTKDNVIITHGPNWKDPNDKNKDSTTVDKPTAVHEPEKHGGDPGKIVDPSHPPSGVRGNPWHLPGGTSAGGEFTHGPGGVSDDGGATKIGAPGKYAIGSTAKELGWPSHSHGMDISDEIVVTHVDTPDVLAIRKWTRNQGESYLLPGRAVMRAAAVDQAYGDGVHNWKGVEIKHDRIAELVIGGPGAGKSSKVANPLSIRMGATMIDADVVKEHLDGYEKGSGSGFVHRESTQLTRGPLLERALNNGDNVVIPMIGGSAHSVREVVGMLHAQNYKVNLRYVEVEKDIQLQRAMSRFRGDERRWVDPVVIVEEGDKPKATFAKLKGRTDLFEHVSWYDNNGKDLITYNIRALMDSMRSSNIPPTPKEKPTPDDVENFYQHLVKTLNATPITPMSKGPIVYNDDDDELVVALEYMRDNAK